MSSHTTHPKLMTITVWPSGWVYGRISCFIFSLLLWHTIVVLLLSGCSWILRAFSSLHIKLVLPNIKHCFKSIAFDKGSKSLIWESKNKMLVTFSSKYLLSTILIFETMDASKFPLIEIRTKLVFLSAHSATILTMFVNEKS